MQEQHLYEYAVIRIVPKVEREEFLNVGIILFCKKRNFITVRYSIDKKRFKLFSEEMDIDQLEMNLLSFKKIADGSKEGGPIAMEDTASRFRWLTATRSSSIQTSKTHPGLSSDLDKTANDLFADFVN